jgi:hypothetical protein
MLFASALVGAVVPKLAAAAQTAMNWRRVGRVMSFMM